MSTLWSSTVFFIVTYCNIIGATLTQDHIGSAVNVFQYFGDLSLEFRVVPRNDTEHWIFRKPPGLMLEDANVKRTFYNRSVGGFRIELCWGKDELHESYFRNILVDGVDKSWKPFSRSWSPSKNSKSLGIKSQLSEDLGYVLLKMEMKKENIELTSKRGLNKKTQELFDAIVANDSESVSTFYENVGTHYVHSYSTGDALFQVLAYEAGNFAYLKKILSDKKSELSVAYLSKYMSPMFAYDIGKVMAVSGNLDMMAWASGALSRKFGRIKSKYPSLLSMMWKPWLLEQFEKRVGPDAIIGLKLELIDRVVNHSSPQKQWYQEITNSMLQLNQENV